MSDDARAIHRRLLAVAPRARVALAGASAAGVAAAALLVVQAWVVANAVDAAAFDGRALGGSAVLALVLVVAGRAVLTGAVELLGRRAAEVALGTLRAQVARRALVGRAPDLDGARRGDLATAATQGLDALAEYYARAVPQLALAAAVPAGVVGVIATREPVVGVLLGITLPIVVVFMVLVGQRSADHARERQRALAVLGAHFLEVVRGLPTLRAHGREQAQAATLRAVGERYRDESLAALRVAFLSALVLELLAMLGTALAAAVIGVQLAQGQTDLSTGLFVLLLAPEVYAPLRAAGARFHAAEDGAQAVRRLLAFLDEPAPFGDDAGAAAARVPAGDLVVRGVTVRGSGGRPDPLRALDLTIPAGASVALVGPSGVGKSTLLRVLARAQDPDAGAVVVGGVALRGGARAAWWEQVTWLDQRPLLPAGTLAEALRIHAPEASDARVATALRQADADGVVAGLADGLATPVGAGGRPLSRGQQQRLALAAALAADTPLLLLDEPTAHLDAASARRVAEGIVAAAEGRTLVVATHDPALAAACDVVVELRPAAAEARTAAGGVRAAAEGRAEAAPGAARAAGGRRWSLGAAVALGVVGAVAGLAVLATSGWLVTRAAEEPPVLALLAAIVVVRALGLTRAFARYYERLAAHDAALRRLAKVRVAFFTRLAARVGQPGLPGTSDLLTRFTSDVDELQHRELRVVLPVAVAAATSAVVVAVGVVILPAAGAALAAGLLLAVAAVPAATHALARRATLRQGPARARFAGELAEALELGAPLAVAGRGPDRLARLTRAGHALARVDRGQARAAALGAAATTLVAGATLLAVLALGTAADLAPVWLGALVLLAAGAFEAPAALPEAALRHTAVRTAAARLADATAGPPLLLDVEGDGGAVEAGGPEELRVQAVTHRPGGPGTPVVLDALDLTIAPGARVAITGPSGAGKSTLADLLARLADPDEGAITLGSTDLRTLPTGEVRRRIRLSGQDAHLLAGTIAANVRIGRSEATDAEVGQALDRAGLAAWRRALPHGLDTLVGEDGVAVSGGQRQRIGLARALLSDAPVLILDEPTAMLDPATARAVLDDVLAATHGRTLIVITHDPTGLDRFDAVVELRDGRATTRPGGGSAPPAGNDEGRCARPSSSLSPSPA